MKIPSLLDTNWQRELRFNFILKIWTILMFNCALYSFDKFVVKNNI